MRFYEHPGSTVAHYVVELVPFRLLCRPRSLPSHRARLLAHMSPTRRLCGRCAHRYQQAQKASNEESGPCA